MGGMGVPVVMFKLVNCIPVCYMYNTRKITLINKIRKVYKKKIFYPVNKHFWEFLPGTNPRSTLEEIERQLVMI